MPPSFGLPSLMNLSGRGSSQGFLFFLVDHEKIRDALGRTLHQLRSSVQRALSDAAQNRFLQGKYRRSSHPCADEKRSRLDGQCSTRYYGFLGKTSSTAEEA